MPLKGRSAIGVLEQAAAVGSSRLDGDKLDVHAGRFCQGAQITRVGGEDVISIVSQADHSGVNRIRSSAACQQHARSAPETLIDRHDLNAGQQPRHRRLPTMPAPPDLGDHPAIRHRRAPGQPLSLHQGDHVAVPPLGRHERTGIQDEHHSTPRPREPPARPSPAPRTMESGAAMPTAQG